MSFFGKNIKKIRGVKNLSQQAFAELFYLKRGTLGAYEEGRSEPKIETIIKIANYFSISIDELLLNELTVNELLKFQENLTINHQDAKFEKFARVPCITEALVADYIAFYEKKNFIADLPTLQLPINPEKIFRAYTVTSLQMTNHDKGFYPKDIVVGEWVPQDVIPKLNNGTLVIALTDAKLIFRRLYLMQGKAILRADHKNIEDMEVPLPMIKELWRVRYVFLKRIPEFSDGMEDKISLIEAELQKMKDKMS